MGVSGRRFFEGLHIDFLLHIDFENGCAIGDRIIFIFLLFWKDSCVGSAAPSCISCGV